MLHDENVVSYEVSNYTPKNIHLIWVGGNIPAKYFFNTIEAAAKAKLAGFNTYLWVDDHKNIINTSAREDIPLAGVIIRNINELMFTIRNYFSPEVARNIILMIKREMVGKKNLSVIADITRLLALFQEGGLYLDIDFKFSRNSIKEKNSGKFQFEPIHVPYGIKILVLSGEKGAVDNCLIAAMPNSIILKKSIEAYIENYSSLDNSEIVQDCFYGKLQRIDRLFNYNKLQDNHINHLKDFNTACFTINKKCHWPIYTERNNSTPLDCLFFKQHDGKYKSKIFPSYQFTAMDVKRAYSDMRLGCDTEKKLLCSITHAAIPILNIMERLIPNLWNSKKSIEDAFINFNIIDEKLDCNLPVIPHWDNNWFSPPSKDKVYSFEAEDSYKAKKFGNV